MRWRCRIASAGSLISILAAAAILAAPAQAGYKDTATVPCMLGFTEFNFLVQVVHAATGIDVRWYDEQGDPIANPSAICSGQSGAPTVERYPNKQNPAKDFVHIQIPQTTAGGLDQTVTVAALAENDLSLVKEVRGGHGDAHNEFKKGEAVEFVLTLKNHGDLAARNVKVKDHIPSRCAFIRASADQGGHPAKGVDVKTPDKGDKGGDVAVDVSRLKAGKTIKIHIVCRATGKEQETLNNVSELSGDPSQTEPDPDPHPNTLEAQFIIKQTS